LLGSGEKKRSILCKTSQHHRCNNAGIFIGILNQRKINDQHTYSRQNPHASSICAVISQDICMITIISSKLTIVLRNSSGQSGEYLRILLVKLIGPQTNQ
jgi:hypothetical protein